MRSMLARLQRNHRTCTIHRLIVVSSVPNHRQDAVSERQLGRWHTVRYASFIRTSVPSAFIDGNPFKVASSDYCHQIPVHEIAALQCQHDQPVYNRLVHRDAAPSKILLLVSGWRSRWTAFTPTLSPSFLLSPAHWRKPRRSAALSHRRLSSRRSSTLTA
ncbi:hypothetical protein L1887_42374 [Cichorium endivia]|nr:hypothetical protein L1887_42374 [Cichorium endivia]